MGLPDRSPRFLATTGQFPAANLLNRLALAGSSKRNPNGFTDTAKRLCGVFTVTRRWLSMRDGSQTYLKPKNGGGVPVTQAVIGTKPLRDKPVEVHSQPTLSGKRGRISYTCYQLGTH